MLQESGHCITEPYEHIGVAEERDSHVKGGVRI